MSTSRTMKSGVKAGVKTARAVGSKIVKAIPPETKQGFHRGRQAGHNAVENIPYGIGAVAGFGVGVVEGAVCLAVTPIYWLGGLFYEYEVDGEAQQA